MLLIECVFNKHLLPLCNAWQLVGIGPSHTTLSRRYDLLQADLLHALRRSMKQSS